MTDVKLLSSFGKSDHVSMKIELGVSLGKEPPPETSVVKKPNWSKVSVNDILDYSYNNIDWYPTSRSLCSQEVWDQLYDKLCKFNEIVPIMRCDSSNRPLSTPWNNTSLKRMRRNKDRAWNSFRENPTSENLNYATLKDKSYSEEEFRLKLEYENRLTNDLKNNCKGFAKLFADDLKMIAKASVKLQVDNDLKMLELWESTWLLEFNVKKCKVLHTSFNNNPHNTYHLNGKVMLTSDQEKDLGVLTTCNLLWNDQINSCVNKANQMICFIARNLISREKSLMLRIYKTLIRPNLEYYVQL